MVVTWVIWLVAFEIINYESVYQECYSRLSLAINPLNINCRSIGVSNFGISHLKEMEKAGLPTPAVNQIELNPYWRLEEIVNYCNEKGIAVMGYCPMFQGQKNDDPVLIEMASR